MSEHTKEPWTLGPAAVRGGDGQVVAKTWGDDGGQELANARRIVACVNACRGISTEALESIKDAWVMRSLELPDMTILVYRMAIEALRREGELLAVLKRVQERNRKMCFVPESAAYAVACQVNQVISKCERPHQEHKADGP